MSFTLHGLAVSEAALRSARRTSSRKPRLRCRTWSSHRAWWKRRSRASTRRWPRCVASFQTMKASMEGSPTDIGAFIDLHLMILSDPELSEMPKQIIRERRCSAEWAIVQQMEVLVAQFEKIDDIYLRERSYDVRQVVERVVRELVGKPGHAGSKPPKTAKGENLIVVAHDLSPADVMAFKDQHFASFVTDVGGATSHTAILARGMGIPGGARPAQRPAADPRQGNDHRRRHARRADRQPRPASLRNTSSRRANSRSGGQAQAPENRARDGARPRQDRPPGEHRRAERRSRR